MNAPVELESKPCPIGCPPADEHVLRGRDRLLELPGEFSVVRCRACGLMRTNPRPTSASMGFYYPDEYAPYISTRVGEVQAQRDLRRSRSMWKGAIRRAFQANNQTPPPLPPGRMLEVGCGSGAFMHAMAQRGWEVEGLEPSESAGKAARALGYPVHIGPLETAPDPQDRYDLIVGWMVLEHLHEPVPALEKLRRWVKPAGWMALSVPDAGSWEFRIFGTRWYDLSLPTHLFHYTPASLRMILGQSGWRVERIFWHNNPNNLFQSLRYLCIDQGRDRWGQYCLDVGEGRRHSRARAILGSLLGKVRASGRMTVWARRS